MAVLTGKYAFMDCVDFKLYPAGTDVSTGLPATDPEGTITIDYLNSSQLTLEMDTQYARIKGNNAVPFNGNRTGTFVCSAECIGMEYMAMIFGGTLDENGNILVTGTAPSNGYVLAGTFRGKKHGDNSEQIFDVILYNVAPQPSVDMTLDATAIGSFDLTFDVLQDEDNNIAKISPHVGA